jgi:hypothetical protein
LIFSYTIVRAQRQQLWFDYQIDYPFSNAYLFEMTSSYQTVLSKDDKWRCLSVTPTFEYYVLTRLDLQATMPTAYTNQTENHNSFETSPALAAIYHITQNKRVNLKVSVKFEERFFRDLEDDTWTSSSRSRLKAEAWISINGPNLYQDKLWYLISDYEEFFVMDEQLEERYANRRRARLGLGYRLDYNHRMELVYSFQSSRNEIEGEFISNDNILQLRYKMFFNPAKPSTP